MEITDYLRVLRKRWRTTAVFVVLCLAAALVLDLSATRKYEATAQLFVSANDTGGLATSLQSAAEFSQDRVQSYADIINSRQITNQVAAQLNVGLTGKQISKEISADAPLNTVLVNLHVTDTSASRATLVANAVATEFTSYAALLEASSSGTGSSGPPVKVTVVKPATLPTSPVSPNGVLDIALGLIVGLLLGIGAAALRETLDNTVKTPDDVQVATGRPVVGVVAFDPDAKANPLIVTQHPHSTRAEAFRQLRTNLQFVDIDTELKSIVITSSVPNEGKTTTVCNLAITIAQAGNRVLLIEADLRRPRLAHYLGLDGSVGLTNILVGTVSIAEATQRWGANQLDVIASGPLPPNPSELLNSKVMGELLHRLESRYDLVLLDAPPLLPVTDAAVLAAETSGAVLIARHGSTTRDQLARSAHALLDGVGARILGSVINMTPKRGPDAYYYGYAYSYRGKARAEGTVVQTTSAPAMPTLRDDPPPRRSDVPSSAVESNGHPTERPVRQPRRRVAVDDDAADLAVATTRPTRSTTRRSAKPDEPDDPDA